MSKGSIVIGTKRPRIFVGGHIRCSGISHCTVHSFLYCKAYFQANVHHKKEIRSLEKEEILLVNSEFENKRIQISMPRNSENVFKLFMQGIFQLNLKRSSMITVISRIYVSVNTTNTVVILLTLLLDFSHKKALLGLK